ncbi:MAG: cysteine--tRNA ligase, partial [Thermodesulfobacteriota bacterium]
SDLLCRYLEYRGYDVTHVMNITDLDDKTINGSAEADLELSEFTQIYIDAFRKDLKVLGIQPADRYPRASEHVEEMVALAEKLVRKGFAYEKLRSLYFDISRFSDYGSLSGIDLEKIRLGSTVDLDEYEKENPRDFTLFKRCRLTELKRGLYTSTDWGNVRPSWHIQCAAMSMKYLGESFDIHTSGRELVFPHHENEIAIAQALTGKPLARFWLHCDRVLENGKKLDLNRSGLTLDDFLGRGYTGREIRFWLLSSHYRKPVRFSGRSLDAARRALGRLDACLRTLRELESGTPYGDLDQLLYDIRQGFITAMDDDLNISAAIASLFKNIKRINSLILSGGLDRAGAEKIIAAFRQIDGVLNVFDFGDEVEDPEIRSLLDKREAARRERNWALADEIRDQLIIKGVVPRDSKLT